ncbi:MAG: hypothetical protein ACREMN_14700, partial [Gemmatimonadales bacterium]
GGTGARRDSGDGASPPAATMTLPGGRTVRLPPGVTEAEVRAMMQKRRAGGELTAEERATLRQVLQPAAGPGGRGDALTYIVFVLRDGKPAPLHIRTGLTDLDHIEVLSGLTERDTVLALPSASLVNAQRRMRERMDRMTGGGLPGLQQQPSGGRSRTPSRP